MRWALKWPDRPALSPMSSKRPSAGRLRSRPCYCSPRAWSLDLYPFLSEWAPTVLGSVAEAALTLLIGWYAWRFFETGLAVKLSPEEGGSQSRARTLQPLLRAVGRLVIGAIALTSALSSLGLSRTIARIEETSAILVRFLTRSIFAQSPKSWARSTDHSGIAFCTISLTAFVARSSEQSDPATACDVETAETARARTARFIVANTFTGSIEETTPPQQRAMRLSAEPPGPLAPPTLAR
jgi:hypothetical protein